MQRKRCGLGKGGARRKLCQETTPKTCQAPVFPICGAACSYAIVKGTLKATSKLGSDDIQLPLSPLSVYLAAKGALIAKKLPMEECISSLAPFQDDSSDVDRKRVRPRFGKAERPLKPIKRITAPAGATSRALD